MPCMHSISSIISILMTHHPPPPLLTADSRQRRHQALACITSVAGVDHDHPELTPQILSDLQYVDGIIAQAVTGDLWARNASWVKKFTKYACEHCEQLIRQHGSQRVLTSDTIATAFLAHVVQENPQATTRVGSAKRAINLLRKRARWRRTLPSGQVSCMGCT